MVGLGSGTALDARPSAFRRDPAAAAVTGLLNDGPARRIPTADSIAFPHLADSEVAQAMRAQVHRQAIVERDGEPGWGIAESETAVSTRRGAFLNGSGSEGRSGREAVWRLQVALTDQRDELVDRLERVRSDSSRERVDASHFEYEYALRAALSGVRVGSAPLGEVMHIGSDVSAYVLSGRPRRWDRRSVEGQGV